MLVACRLAGLSALEGHYAGVRVRAQLAGVAGGKWAAFLDSGVQSLVDAQDGRRAASGHPDGVLRRRLGVWR
jgi:hypothetical protein